MAWGVKYTKKFQRIGITATYRVDILSEVGGAIITPDRMGVDPFTLKTLAAGKDEDKVVIGSEATFEFILKKRAGEANYDPLFESEYRDYIVKFYNDDTTTLLWQGYLQPENMSKDIFESNLHIYLSASDALKDLKDFDFLDSGSIVSERKTGLQIIKIALANLGSEFEFNFIVKLGLKHDGQGADDNPLEEITHDTRRFANVRDGKTEIDDCLDVIEKILTPYSCILKQWGGQYHIQQRYEGDTENYTYNWALAWQSTTNATDSVNIDDYTFRRGAEVSKLSPVKEIGIKLLNRNIGGSEAPLINNFPTGVGCGWDYGNWNNMGSDLTATYMGLKVMAPFAFDNGYVTLAADLSLTNLTDNDYLKLRFAYKHTSTDTNYLHWPQFRITITKAGASFIEAEYVYINQIPLLYESSISTNFKLIGNIGGPAVDYNIQIELISGTGLNDINIQLSEFDISISSIVDEENVEDITFDSYHAGTISQGKIKKSIEAYFGDSGLVTDFAALLYSGAVTSKWDRYGNAGEDKPLFQLLAKEYLISRQDYAEYLMLDIKDTGDNITPINFIQWDSNIYNIVSYEKSWRSSWIRLHLKQRFTIDKTIGWQVNQLTSVDGESSGSSTPYSPSPGSSDWGSITGKPAWVTGATDVGQNIATLIDPGAIAFIRINADDSVDALSAALFKGALSLDNVTNESKATMFTNPSFTGTVELPLVTLSNAFTLTDTGYFKGSPTNGVRFNNNAGASNNFIIYDNGDTYTRGNVGINVLNPSITLEANCGTDNISIKTISTDQYNNIYVEDTGGIASFGVSNGALTLGSDTLRYVTITTTGLVGIGTTAGLSKLSINGGVHVGGDSDAGDDNLWIDGVTSEPTYVAGWTINGGTTWGITAAGDASFENLMVRGSARFKELIIDQLSVIGGSTLQSAARGKVASIDVANSKVTLEDPNNKGACQFEDDDFFWSKNIDIDGGLFSDNRGQISDVTGLVLTLDFTVVGNNGSINDFAVGDVIIQRGHPTTVARQNLIYTSVSDTNAPFSKVMTGIDTLAAFGTLANITLQYGNLADLDSHDIVPATPGYGLYSDNVYLSGTIHAEDGEIGGWDINSAYLIKDTGVAATSSGMAPADHPFYAGSAYVNRHFAPFNVTSKGQVAATRLAVSGNIINAYNSGAASLLTHDAEVSTTQLAYAPVKGITLGANVTEDRTLKIRFRLKSGDAGLATNVYAKIYRDGIAVGTERVTLQTAYQTYSQDIIDWNAGDIIQIYAYTTNATHAAYVDEFRVLGSHGGAVVDEVTGSNTFP